MPDSNAWIEMGWPSNLRPGQSLESYSREAWTLWGLMSNPEGPMLEQKEALALMLWALHRPACRISLAGIQVPQMAI